MTRRSARFSIIALLLLAITGCTSHELGIPVYGAGESKGNRGVYVVKRGDTLYSIAFRYGVDFRALARANGIAPPYTIFVDQRLRLVAASDPVTDGAPDQPVASNRSDPRPETRPKPAPRPAPVPRQIEAPSACDDCIDWQWPFEGELVGRFSLTGNINKGIDIRGEAGDPVRSSADGVVVYAGGGLRGYGKLVIVKHNDRYLSAYAHNETIVVSEGDRVERGQVVARIGGSTGDNDVMHFEIRRDGKPRDPLGYLPPRS